jgi:cardiolipin synthase
MTPRHEPPRAPTLRVARPPIRELLNLPNLLTLLRLFLIPVFLGFVGRHEYTEALYVFVAAALTDSLDGTVARWFHAKTELGAFLDPLADKLMLLSAFVALTFEHEMEIWVLGVVIIRDVVIVVGYFMISFVTGERIPVRPSYLGKASTFFQLACIVGALVQLESIYQQQWYALLYTMVAFTAVSGMHYVYRGLVWLFYREPQLFEQ